MSWLEVAANATYVISVVLANRNSVHTWWTGIVGCVLFGVVFFESRLYADLTLQGFFVVTSLLGWWHWLHGDAGSAVPVRRTPARLLLRHAALAIACGAGYGAALAIGTDAALPLWDSFGAAASVLAQLLLMGRRYETWWFWLVANTVYVPLYTTRDLPLTALVYAAFWVNAVVSLIRWRKLVVA